MKDTGLMTKPMAMVFTSMLMVPNMKASGRTTCNTARELRSGLTAPNTQEITLLEENTVSVHTNGTMEVSILEIGVKTKYLE